MSKVQPFYGAVILKEWFKHVDGNNYLGVVGQISIVNDEEHLGFKVNTKESNWAACVGAVEGDAHFILGCQIRSFVRLSEGSDEQIHKDFLIVR